MFALEFKEGSYRLHVDRSIRVKNDQIIEVGHHVCQIFSDFLSHLDEPAGRTSAALRRDGPLVEARGGVKRCERDGVVMRGCLVERGDQIEEGKHPPPPQGIEGLAHVGNKQLAGAVDLLEFLVVHGDPNDSRLLRDDYQWA